MGKSSLAIIGGCLAVAIGVKYNQHNEAKLVAKLEEQGLKRGFSEPNTEQVLRFVRPGHEDLAEERTGTFNLDFQLKADTPMVAWWGDTGTAKGLHNAFMDKYKPILEQVDGWSFQETVGSATVEVFDQQTHGMNLFRAKGIVNLSPVQLRNLLEDIDVLGILDETVNFGLMYNSPTPEFHSTLSYFTVDVPPLQPRDTVDLSTWESDADGTLWQTSFGVASDSTFPMTESRIRIATMVWMYKIVPKVNADGTVVSDTTLMWQVDIKGWMPKWISNLTTGKVVTTSYFDHINHIAFGMHAAAAAAAQTIDEHSIEE